MRSLLSFYRLHFADVLVYMLQNVEYRPGPYLQWFWRTHNFDSVMQRRQLEKTRPARLLLLALRIGMFLQVSLGVGCTVQWVWQGLPAGWQIGLALIISYPIVWAHLVTIPLAIGGWFIIAPRHRKAIRRSTKTFAEHKAVRIAVAGSYGKTTMKELLNTVLGEGLLVAVTPANKNVSISHARFAKTLTGDEDVIVVEFGEGKPGDIRRFAQHIQPSHAIITGLAAAHLDRYKTMDAVAFDLLTLRDFVPAENVYIQDTELLRKYAGEAYYYGNEEVLGWQISDISVAIDQTCFTMLKEGQVLHLVSGLIGRHNVAALGLAVALGLELGMSADQVVAGVAKTQPFEHRMQPRTVNGAVLIDDTYNGNLEGVRAGTALLKELDAKRKWYVTPGLVDQGKDSDVIHYQMGKLIADAKPDTVVLMDNSARRHIAAGLKAAGYAGQIRIESNPLEFYTTLPHFIAAGDIVLLQNDWTDNYA